MSRWHEISGCSNPKRKVDVLFIHGLGGDALFTWGKGPDQSTFWPARVGKKFSEIGVWSLDYAASPTKWTRILRKLSRRWRDDGHSMALPDRAVQVLDLMAQRDLGQRHIVFVCHSLGGLLVKQILRTSADASEPSLRAVFANTCAVLFLATPHTGANLANLADAFRLVFNGTVSIRDLEAHNAPLRDLYNWYRRHSVDAGIRTGTYYEARSTKGVTIVTPSSAHPGVGSDPVGLDEDHISICKPREDGQQVCGALDHIIRDCLGTQEAGDSASASARNVLPPESPALSRVSVSIQIEFDLDADLRDLIARGLLLHDAQEGRFDLHPIVRRYAYDRLASRDRTAAHTQLRDYFAAVPAPDEVTRLEDLASVIELYHHTVRAGQLNEACDLYYDRLTIPLFYQLGAYQLITDLLRALFPDGEGHPPHLKKEGDQALALGSLANSYSLSGQPRSAVPLFQRQIAIHEKQGDKRYLAVGLGNMATQQMTFGMLKAAEANLHQRIALCRETKDKFNEAVGHQELGRLLAYRGADAESETTLATALAIFEKQDNVQSQGVVCAYGALRQLLLLRRPGVATDLKRNAETDSTGVLRASAFPNPLAPARRALVLADEMARTIHAIERDYVRAHWLLGAAYRVANQPYEAEHHLHEALECCRRIKAVDSEADILIDLARLRAATGAADEARRLADEARVIAERSDYVLQGADAHLELARLALTRGERTTAREHAEEAHRLATCDGPPDYTYKAAYDEAAALLDDLAS